MLYLGYFGSQRVLHVGNLCRYEKTSPHNDVVGNGANGNIHSELMIGGCDDTSVGDGQPGNYPTWGR